jgi:hypothetical protein
MGANRSAQQAEVICAATANPGARYAIKKKHIRLFAEQFSRHLQACSASVKDPMRAPS